MLMEDKIAYPVSIKDSDAQAIQRTFGFYYCDYEQGVHLVFKSRHLAERFGIEYMGLTKNQFSTVKVTSQNGKDLGFEILIAAVLIADFDFSEEGD